MVCFCCFVILSSVLCFRVIPCVMYFISFYGGGFFKCVNDFLVSFSSSAISILMFFPVCACPAYTILSLFLYILAMYVLPRHVDQESSHDTSVVTSHVDHVVGLGVLNVYQISSLGQHVVNLFFFPFWRDEGRLFLRSLPEHRIESGVVYLSTLLRSVPFPSPNSALKSRPMIGMYVPLCTMWFSIVLYIFSMWWSAYLEW